MPDRSMCDAKEWLNQLVDQESPKINVTKNLQVVIHYLQNKVGVVDFANAQGLVMF